jgi:hypothetical protein
MHIVVSGFKARHYVFSMVAILYQTSSFIGILAQIIGIGWKTAPQTSNVSLDLT